MAVLLSSITNILLSFMQRVLAKIVQEFPRDQYWLLREESAKFIGVLIAIFRPKVFLEIGTGVGYSGIYLAENLAKFGGRLLTVESHAERFAIAKQHFAEAGLTETITQVAGHAPEVFPQITGNFDMC